MSIEPRRLTRDELVFALAEADLPDDRLENYILYLEQQRARLVGLLKDALPCVDEDDRRVSGGNNWKSQLTLEIEAALKEAGDGH